MHISPHFFVCLLLSLSTPCSHPLFSACYSTDRWLHGVETILQFRYADWPHRHTILKAMFLHLLYPFNFRLHTNTIICFLADSRKNMWLNFQCTGSHMWNDLIILRKRFDEFISSTSQVFMWLDCQCTDIHMWNHSIILRKRFDDFISTTSYISKTLGSVAVTSHIWQVNNRAVK